MTTTVKVNREDFLQTLQSVQAGLSPRDIVEQSSCLIFKSGEVMTFNDEVACRTKSTLNGKFEGAVHAAPLISILEKLEEEHVDLEATESELIVKGKRRRAGIRMEQEILLAIGTVEEPTEWKKLHEDFLEALTMVAECAGKDESKFNLTCIHLHPKYLEACDNVQAARFNLKTRMSAETLVRRDSVKHITTLGMSEFSETDSWLHFRNSDGLLLSCRRFFQEYPDLGPVLDVSGDKVALPKGLGKAIECAEIFSSENTDDDQILIQMRPGKIRIKGQGASGWYSESRKMPSYKGPQMEFMIGPKIFLEITKKHNECEISQQKLRVSDSTRFTYVSCLSIAGEEEPEETESNDKDE